MATTTNFGWETPDDTDLVKDGAAAIRTLGQSIDTSMADLEGGTTGQVLSKASNADMDFTWVTSDDANAIQNSIVDAKGDLIAATANDTPARLAVGTNGHVLTADSTAATGIKWAAPASSGALTLISTTPFTSSTAVNIDNVFSTTYQYYKIIINITSVSVATSIFQRMRVGGADATSGYLSRFLNQNSTTISGQNQTQGFYLGETNTTGVTWFSHSQEILNAFETRPTQMIGAGTESDGGTFKQTKTGGVLDNSTSYTGTTFYPISGNITGTVRVYAYANS